jgi:hypothetical protein
MNSQLFKTFVLFALSAVVACSGAPADEASEDDLTGTTAVERSIAMQGYVYVAENASDDAIKTAIAREVKTAIGALRATKVALADRGARSNLDPKRWTRTPVTLVDPSDPKKVTGKLLRVTFPYEDRAAVTKSLAARSTVDLTMLMGDYASHDAALKQSCSDDATTDTDSLWYHYAPQMAACRQKVQTELAAIAVEKQKIGGDGTTIGPAEASRWFLSVTAKLGAPKVPAQAFSPEYDRLFGAGTSKDKVVVYAFFGVDAEEANPDDALAQEAVRFLRAMLAGQPNFRPVHTDPATMLLDVFVDGKKLDGVTYARMFQWLLDKSGYPVEVGTDTNKIAALRRAALEKLTERWIYWDLPVQVTDPNGAKRAVTIEVRTFYGYEDGSADARQHAQWRYLEALWYGDVFLYNGHSHFGHGPLEPTLYGPQNFNDRYQIMLVNSCISFNYYHQDFFEKKPGGTKNLDMIVNGLPSWVWGGGEATARFMLGLISGKQPSYVDLLGQMRLDMPWGEKSYDPMRVADGELDNVFSQQRTPMALMPLGPVYP